ncbi:hypothetical protein [Listeria phage vB_Lmo_3274]
MRIRWLLMIFGTMVLDIKKARIAVRALKI